jgi:hypothetical protein
VESLPRSSLARNQFAKTSSIVTAIVPALGARLPGLRSSKGDHSLGTL